MNTIISQIIYMYVATYTNITTLPLQYYSELIYSLVYVCAKFHWLLFPLQYDGT